MEFRTLMRRKMQSAAPAAEAKPKSKGGYVQGDMFAAMEPDTGGSDPQGDLFAAAGQGSSMHTWKDSGAQYHLVDTPEKRAALIQTLASASELCIDTETTDTDPMRATLVGMSFAISEGEAWYVPVGDDPCGVAGEFKAVLENPATLKIGQNMKYDLQVLRSCGIRLAGPMFDTMIAHYLLHPEMRHGMDYLAEAYLNYQTIHIEELIGTGKRQRSMADVPAQDVCPYAAEDADITLRLKNILEPKLKELELEDLFWNVEMPLVPVLASMEMNGVCIDTNTLKETSSNLSNRLAEIEHHIYELAGESFNIASPRQVGEILFGKMKIVEKPKKTKTGQYVTSEEVLQQLRSKSPIIDEILNYRGLKKLLSTYVDALPKLINPRTGHIHASFNQAITATGRLSSSDPNLQNIPVRDDDGKEIRRCFIPEPGCLFFSADYSQIELRIMAHLSEDKNMVEAFREGSDIHAATAAKIWHEEISQVTDAQRKKAKTANFGIIYGITTFGLAQRMNIENKEAKQIIEDYFRTFPGVKAYMEKSKEIAREKGYAETIFHRRRYLPDISSRNGTVRGFAERNAINAPIQGSEADIIKVAMVRIFNRFKAEGIKSKMIIQVHDELNFSVYPEEKEKVEKIVVEEMQNAYHLSVPLVADAGWGKNWLEAH